MVTEGEGMRVQHLVFICRDQADKGMSYLLNHSRSVGLFLNLIQVPFLRECWRGINYHEEASHFVVDSDEMCEVLWRWRLVCAS